MPIMPDHDLLSTFELPGDVMSATLEHAISDDATMVHELGHAVASQLETALAGSRVEFGFPGMLSVTLRSGAVARCGGPTLGWMIDLQRMPGADIRTIDVDLSDTERNPAQIAHALARALKRW